MSPLKRNAGREGGPKATNSEDITRATMEPCQPDAPLYNSGIIASFVRFIERYYDQIDINELLYYAKMEPYQVQDENYWFNQEQVDLFHEKLVVLTKNKNIAREAGRYAVSTDSLGVAKSYALGFVNPARICEIIGKASEKVVRSCVWEATRVGPNKVQIKVTPKPGTNEKPYQCENRIGYLESIFALFKHKLPKIEHTECVFKGGRYCRYLVTWHTFRSDVWRKVRNYLAASLLALSLGFLYFSMPGAWVASMIVSLVAVFLLSHRIWNMEKEELVAAVQNLTDSTDALFEKLNVSYNNARLIHEVGLTLTKQRHIDGILQDVAQILEKRLDYDRGMILLADKEKTALTFGACFGYMDEQLSALRRASFRLRPGSKGILAVCFRERKPFLINDIDEISHDLSPHSLEFVREMGVKSFICCPIVCVDDAIGVLAVDNVKTKRVLLQSDIDLLMALSPEIGISIQNAMVTDTKERQFNALLEGEEKIRASLKEKEVLLKEIHHRVKNNLQIVSSLLYMQAAKTEHPGAVLALKESRARIKSMALIHERLYQSPNLASVDMGGYTRSLVSDLQHFYRTEESSVRLTVKIDDMPLGITEAIPCGLIINELVSNGLKHAFPKGGEGEITIQMQKQDTNRIVLIVSDSGIGFPKDVDIRNSPSLGLTLVNSLVEQLDGTIELDRRGGTTFTIRFG
ncbi:MAG: histidine kinase dimerization/phosphoacceptor domain -containing protein [Syntrophorhabdales bacterium]